MGNDYAFIPNIWVTFEFNEQYCLGRTLYDNTGLGIVSFVNSNGDTGIIPFFLVKNPKKLNIGIFQNQYAQNSQNKSENIIGKTIDENIDENVNSNKQIINKILNINNKPNFGNIGMFTMKNQPIPILISSNSGNFILN